MTSAMDALAPSGPSALAAIAGIGIDLCPPARMAQARERWGTRARAIFSPAELDAFPGGELAVPWAAREAALKAVGLPSVLGAPLGDFRVVPAADGRLAFDLGPAARAALEARGLATLALAVTRVAGVVLALATAHAPGAAPHAIAWGALPARGAPSATARAAALLALRPLLPAADPAAATWTGGADRAPALALPGGPPILVSLTHDGGLAAAAVAVPAPEARR